MTIVYGGVPYNFNAEWATTQTEAQFCEHEAHHGLTKSQLKEAYKLCKAVVKPTEAKPKSDPIP